MVYASRRVFGRLSRKYRASSERRMRRDIYTATPTVDARCVGCRNDGAYRNWRVDFDDALFGKLQIATTVRAKGYGNCAADCADLYLRGYHERF